MNRWWILAGVVIAALLGAAFVAGTRLPVQHSASATERFDVSVETLWAAATDYRGYPLWRTEVDAVERLPDLEGQVAWEETGGTGEITVLIEESVRPTRFVIRIADEVARRAFGGTWTFTFRAEGNASELTIREDGEIYNPLFRFLAHYVVGHDRAIRRFLDDLGVYVTEATFPTGLPPTTPSTAPPSAELPSTELPLGEPPSTAPPPSDTPPTGP